MIHIEEKTSFMIKSLASSKKKQNLMKSAYYVTFEEDIFKSMLSVRKANVTYAKIHAQFPHQPAAEI